MSCDTGFLVYRKLRESLNHQNTTAHGQTEIKSESTNIRERRLFSLVYAL